MTPVIAQYGTGAMVFYRNIMVGQVWTDDTGRWHALSTVGDVAQPFIHTTATREQAARWVCLRARPIVYRVKRVTLPGADGPTWAIVPIVPLPSGGLTTAYRREHPAAVAFATDHARRTLEATPQGGHDGP